MLQKKDTAENETQPQPTSEDEEKPKFQRSQKRGGFKGEPPAEAEALFMYEATKDNYLEGMDLKKEQLLIEMADKYNAIMRFLNRFDKNKRDFLSFILINAIPKFETIETARIL